MRSRPARLRFDTIVSKCNKQFGCYPKLVVDCVSHGSSKFVNNQAYLNKGRPVIRMKLPDEMIRQKDDSKYAVPEYDFVQSVVMYCHEFYHCLEYTCSDKNDELVSYISRQYNNLTYDNKQCNEYHKFSYEIAAERFALHYARDVLSGYFDTNDLDEILIDYVNAKINFDQPSDGTFYFIHSPDTTSCLFTNMDDVFEAFDNAYDKSFVEKKDFEGHIVFDGENAGAYISHEDDLVGRVLKDNPSAKSKYDTCKDGREQMFLVASIVLGHHPELYKQHKFLNKNDFDKEFVVPKKSIFDAIRNPSHSYSVRAMEFDIEENNDSDDFHMDPTDDW